MDQTLVLYTSALCNLRCTYCYIDKNPILAEIDKKLEESFLNKDYYLDFSKELFNRNDLNEIQFWGGEPSQGLHRVIPILKDLLDYYPNLTRFMMSTNLTLPQWFKEVYGFLKELENYPRNFYFGFQLSIDGPEYINDITRGENTTKLFLQNYNKFIKTLKENLPKNVEVRLWFKPTLSSETISFLQTKEKVLEYFRFFDSLIDQAKKNFGNFSNITIDASIPNTACPSPHTVQDSKNFTNYCKICYEISKEQVENKTYFNNYTTITSFVRKAPNKDTYHCGFCGGGVRTIGLLPERKISICHNGFTDLMLAYRELANKNKVLDRSIVQELFKSNMGIFSACMDLKDFAIYKNMITCYECQDSRAAFNNLVLTIQMLAQSGQIEKKYNKMEEAIQGAQFYTSHTANCIRDNMNTSGSILIPPVGLIKLLLNGAKEYIDATEELL